MTCFSISNYFNLPHHNIPTFNLEDIISEIETVCKRLNAYQMPALSFFILVTESLFVWSKFHMISTLSTNCLRTRTKRLTNQESCLEQVQDFGTSD